MEVSRRLTAPGYQSTPAPLRRISTGGRAGPQGTGYGDRSPYLFRPGRLRFVGEGIGTATAGVPADVRRRRRRWSTQPLTAPLPVRLNEAGSGRDRSARSLSVHPPDPTRQLVQLAGTVLARHRAHYASCSPAPCSPASCPPGTVLASRGYPDAPQGDTTEARNGERRRRRLGGPPTTPPRIGRHSRRGRADAFPDEATLLRSGPRGGPVPIPNRQPHPTRRPSLAR
jgi:hypothetical protein